VERLRVHKRSRKSYDSNVGIRSSYCTLGVLHLYSGPRLIDMNVSQQKDAKVLIAFRRGSCNTSEMTLGRVLGFDLGILFDCERPWGKGSPKLRKCHAEK